MNQEKQYSKEEKLVMTLEELANSTDSEERKAELADIKQKILVKQQDNKVYEK